MSEAATSNRAATVIWLVLVVLTLVTYFVGEGLHGGPAIAALVLAIALVKGQLVADWFMGLRRVRAFWRGVMLGWLFVVCGVIGLAYAMSL